MLRTTDEVFASRGSGKRILVSERSAMIDTYLQDTTLAGPSVQITACSSFSVSLPSGVVILFCRTLFHTDAQEELIIDLFASSHLLLLLLVMLVIFGPSNSGTSAVR